MDIIGLDDFISHCEKGVCLRHTFFTQQCVKETKQMRCYFKYLSKEQEKIRKFETGDIKDHKWEKIRKEVWLRDAGHEPILMKQIDVKDDQWKIYCRLWKSLTATQQDYVLDNHIQELWLNNYLDCCHILPKDLYPDLKYNLDNIILMGRYFHQLLDDFKNPVTKEKISEKQRLEFFELCKKY